MSRSMMGRMVLYNPTLDDLGPAALRGFGADPIVPKPMTALVIGETTHTLTLKVFDAHGGESTVFDVPYVDDPKAHQGDLAGRAMPLPA